MENDTFIEKDEIDQLSITNTDSDSDAYDLAALDPQLADHIVSEYDFQNPFYLSMNGSKLFSKN